MIRSRVSKTIAVPLFVLVLIKKLVNMLSTKLNSVFSVAFRRLAVGNVLILRRNKLFH